MIAYLDLSVLARAYLHDEAGHDDAVALLGNEEIGLITGTWTRVEVSGALIRAAKVGRGDVRGLLQLLDANLATEGAVTVVVADQAEIEERALAIVRKHGIRAMVARHLAATAMTPPDLAEPEEEIAFATRDERQ